MASKAKKADGGKKPVQKSGKTPAPAPGSGAKKPAAKGTKTWHSEHGHLFAKSPNDYRIGRDIQPKRDLSRFVKWPRYVRLQRQRAILKKRLKVPPAINQFAKTLEKNTATTLFSLLANYRPETGAEKKKRLAVKAEAEKKGEVKLSDEAKAANKPRVLKFGLNHITELVEKKKAKLVVIAHDVDPIELVVWLPALCRKMDVPYCIVKGKARLGHLVHQKTATAVALVDIKKEDNSKLEQLVSTIRIMYNDNVSDRRKWGGAVMGLKANHIQIKREKAKAREAASKAAKAAR
jgi:large subunit ribosomal protein L7Ae